jgi:hypothetical protein
MKTERINDRIRFSVRWSPLLLAAAVVWLYFGWRHQAVSVAYIVACVGVGLLCGSLLIVSSWKNQPPLSLLAFVIFYSAPMLLGLFFPKLDVLMGGKISYKYMSTVVVSILGLVVVLRRLMMRVSLRPMTTKSLDPSTDGLFSNRMVRCRLNASAAVGDHYGKLSIAGPAGFQSFQELID